LLHPTGLRTLETGQKIRMQVTDSSRGREAVELELAE
jgi:cold shock CspA family protein